MIGTLAAIGYLLAADIAMAAVKPNWGYEDSISSEEFLGFLKDRPE